MQMCVLQPVLTRLREAVYPAVEGYWRADATVTTFLDDSLPRAVVNQSSCGPAALGAFFHPDRVAAATSDHQTSWMNRKMMEASLKKLGVDFRKCPEILPPQGVALIQRVSKPEKKSFRGSFLADTHWIAVIDSYVFDVNWPQWLPSCHWKSLVGRPLAEWHGAVSWKVVTGYEILIGSGSSR